MNYQLNKIIPGLLIILVAGFSACRSTRYVPDEKYLLNSVRIKSDNKELKKDEIKRHIRQKPNVRILGMFRLKLGLYNLSSKKKENDWLKRIGERPVVYEDFQKRRTVDNLQAYLKNKGYYNAVVHDTVIYNNNKQKVKVRYGVVTGEPYRVGAIGYSVTDSVIAGLFTNELQNTLIKEASLFDGDKLDEERTRLTRVAREHGYYKFTKDYISLLADSLSGEGKIDITWKVGKYKNGAIGETEEHPRFVIDSIIVFPNYEPPKALVDNNEVELSFDTLLVGKYMFLFKDGKKRIAPSVLLNTIRMKPGEIYKQGNIEKTYNSLAAIRQFRFVNMTFEETGETDSLGYKKLKCLLQLSPHALQSYSFDIEGTNSSGNMGVAGNLRYQHRNIFKGAEIFSVGLRGAVEQQAVNNELSTTFNTREIGVETELMIPEFWVPVKARKLYKYAIPRTRFNLSYNYQRRPYYTRTIASTRFGYNWKSSVNSNHVINLVDFNLVHLPAIKQDFLDKIKDFNILSSYKSHLIFASNYSYLYNKKSGPYSNYTYFRFSVESSGGLLHLLNKWTGGKKKTDENGDRYYKFFDTHFSQYIKTDLEFRYGLILDKYNSFVFRSFFGVGLPYENSKLMPFEKLYFTGGANGMRAWAGRSLGPGKYKAGENDFPNQMSDIKLEANLEYRFRMFWRLEGALFLDAGNIWAIRKIEGMPEAEFDFGRFYKEVALGTGFGTRINLNYFIFRLDIGMKLCDPSAEAGKRWIPGSRRYIRDDFNVNLAIGYPF